MDHLKRILFCAIAYYGICFQVGAYATPALENIMLTENIDAPTAEEVKKASEEIARRFPESVILPTGAERSSVLNQYGHLDPQNLVPDNLLSSAVLYFHAHRSGFDNQRYMTIVDFSRRSNLTRMFLVNMVTGGVHALRTTHGRNSDTNNDGYAESFGNVPGSLKSSVGFYRVAEIYFGAYGRSIRLDGLSSTNSKVRARAIVIHGSDYVHEANVIQGRSNGCFALAWSVKDQVVDRIHGGSLLYAHVSQ